MKNYGENQQIWNEPGYKQFFIYTYHIFQVFKLLLPHLHQRRKNTKLLLQDCSQKLLITTFYCVKLTPWDMNWSIVQHQINLPKKSIINIVKNSELLLELKKKIIKMYFMNGKIRSFGMAKKPLTLQKK